MMGPHALRKLGVTTSLAQQKGPIGDHPSGGAFLIGDSMPNEWTARQHKLAASIKANAVEHSRNLVEEDLIDVLFLLTERMTVEGNGAEPETNPYPQAQVPAGRRWVAKKMRWFSVDHATGEITEVQEQRARTALEGLEKQGVIHRVPFAEITYDKLRQAITTGTLAGKYAKPPLIWSITRPTLLSEDDYDE